MLLHNWLFALPSFNHQIKVWTKAHYEKLANMLHHLAGKGLTKKRAGNLACALKLFRLDLFTCCLFSIGVYEVATLSICFFFIKKKEIGLRGYERKDEKWIEPKIKTEDIAEVDQNLG